MLGLIVLSGCSTIESRIKEDATFFESLDPQVREKLRQGSIGLGYTERMVLIALGAPDEKEETRIDTRIVASWIYLSYHHDYAGRAIIGYRRHAYKDPKTGVVSVFAEPVYTDLYRAEAEERLRVILSNGKVIAIEQEK